MFIYLLLCTKQKKKMIIFLSELQKEHLNLINQQPINVLVDLCKLAIDYLNNGPNSKKFDVAAEKLQVSSTNVQNVIHAIVYLLLEGCKHDLLEQDFKSSLAIAGFSAEQQEVLLKLYNSRKEELSVCLNLMCQKDPVYQDLAWRLEVQVAARYSNKELKPMVAMDFILKCPKNFQSSNIADFEHSNYPKKTSSESTVCVDRPIQDAKTANQCQYTVKHVLLHCDLPNLVHMTNKLDEALKESKGQHVRKVQRALK